MAVFILWVVSIVLSLFIARNKGTSLGFALLLSLLFGPLGLLVVFLSTLSGCSSVKINNCTVDSLHGLREEISAMKSSTAVLQRSIERLECSVAKAIENKENKASSALPEQPERFAPDNSVEKKENFEFVFGKYWLSRIGVVLFVAGMGFFANLALGAFSAVLKVLMGYVLAGLFFVWGSRLEKSDNLKRIGWGVLGGAWGMLYLTTYAMYYIKFTKIIASPAIEFILLALVSVAAIAYSFKYKQWVITAVMYILAFFTAGLGGMEYSTIIYCAILCASVAYLSYKLDWPKFLLCAIFGIYLMYAYWLRDQIFFGVINAVSAGNSIYKFQLGLGTIVVTWLIFYLSALFTQKKNDESSNKYIYFAVIANCAFAALLGLKEINYFVSRIHIKWDIAFFYFLIMALFYVAAFFIYRARQSVKFTFLSVCLVFSFLAMAVAVSNANMPVTLFWLIELLLVFMMLANYREKSFRVVLIVLSIIALYRLLFIDYSDCARYSLLGLNLKHNIFIFTVAQVIYFILALGVERENVWGVFSSKEAVFYKYTPLAVALFFMFLLMNTLNSSWVTLGWVILGAAILAAGFFGKSRLYRICGLSVSALAFLRLFFVDLKEMNTVYRVVTFMVFGAILLGVSFIYSNLPDRDRLKR